MELSAERQSSQSSVRLIQIMECLAANYSPMRLQDIARQVGMTQSTVLRYLYALESTHYVYRDEEMARYGLTWRVCKLGENLNSMLSLRNLANPFINQLANTLSLGVCLVTDRDHECLYLDCIDNPRSQTLQHIGKQAPLHVTGSGKLLLSQYTREEVELYISTAGLVKYTEHTITDPRALEQELVKIRQRDFGMDREECELGLHCISCPLRDYTGRIIAAVSVFGNVADMSETRLEKEIYPALRKASEAISMRLGYTRP